jgi:ABC-type transporter Mla subunit MlaD
MTTIIETILENLTTLAGKMNAMRSEYDGLAFSLNETGKGLRELIDGVRAGLDQRRDGETAIALGLSDRINELTRNLASFSADSIAMYETSRTDLFEVNKRVLVLSNSFTAITGPLEQPNADAEKRVQGILDRANARIEVLLKNRDFHKEKAQNERKRAAALVRGFRSSGFRVSDRERLACQIQETK